MKSMEKGGNSQVLMLTLSTKRQKVKEGTIWKEGGWFYHRCSEMEIPVEHASGNAWQAVLE